MQECFKCGISENKAILIDAITDKGIKKICQKCSGSENIPLIRQPNILRLEESEKKQSVYQRMSRISGVREEKNAIINKELQKQDTSLRNIVEKNFKSEFKKVENPNDLIRNFHWTLMRARRLKKITIEQLAEKINEPVAAVKMAEQGILKENYSRLIKKLEDALSIRLFKDEFVKRERAIEVVPTEALGKPEEVFEKNTSRILTISDLKKLKNVHEEKILEQDDNLPEFIEVNEKDIYEKELTPEEVDNVLEKEIQASKKTSSIRNLFKKKEPEKKSSKENDISQEEINKILFGS